MPRAKTVVPGRARRRKVLKAAKGNYSGRRKLFKSALQTVQRRPVRVRTPSHAQA
jgi:ribosomal protein L20